MTVDPRQSAGIVRLRACAAVAACLLTCACFARARQAERVETLVVRGHPLTLHIYGSRGGDPVIVSSGDGGWIHLGPHAAATLASSGFFVVGVDAREYLEAFTSSRSTLRPEDVPGDYSAILAFAAQGTKTKPILVGVSEGAGLSVLAATDPAVRCVAGGVVGLGLPAVNELGWRWRDAVIYLTHTVPQEPTFETAPIIGKVTPLPLALIQSTHDEYVSPADARALYERAANPKRLWTVAAADHSFSDNRAAFDTALLEAIRWIREQDTP
jgi:alpha-beta hydrolase superfamily lysophospholipase